MLMFLGISGRFMFFTADTARAGAPAIPAYTHTHAQKTHTRRVDKTNQWSRKHAVTGRDTEKWTLDTHSAKQSTRQSTADKMQKHWQLLRQTTCANVHSDAFIASYAHALFFLFSREWLDHNQSQLCVNGEDILYYTIHWFWALLHIHQMDKRQHCLESESTGLLRTDKVKMEGENWVKQKNGFWYEDGNDVRIDRWVDFRKCTMFALGVIVQVILYL